MLKAVSKMLPTEENSLDSEYKAKVACAKVIIDELIVGLTQEPGEPLSFPNPVSRETARPTVQPKATPQPTQTVVVEDEEPQYLITVDENKGLKMIGAPDDFPLEVDGVKTTYGEAKGKLFKKVRML